MARIFVSHASADNASAKALSDWLIESGWNDQFLDFHEDHGITAGTRWEQALTEQAHRCQAVILMVSRRWLDSRPCRDELDLASRLNKRLFGVLIEDLPSRDLPEALRAWQVVRLNGDAGGQRSFGVKLPFTGEAAVAHFSIEGLARLGVGLKRAGLDASFFDWPPESDPERIPYRGLAPLVVEDAGILFGRDAPIVTTLDMLRGLRLAGGPRLLAILGASGAGKSSFLRAGLIPRLARDDRNFIALPVTRPTSAVLSGEDGLYRNLQRAAANAGMSVSAPAGVDQACQVMARLVGDAHRLLRQNDEDVLRPPTLLISIDQAEELFLAEGKAEAELFFSMLQRLLSELDVIVVFAIRTDHYEPLQASLGAARALEGIAQQTVSLPPLPKGMYASVVEGPAQRSKDSRRPLTIEPQLTQKLLDDLGAGDAKDSLPLLAFTLERLYRLRGSSGKLRLEDYEVHLNGMHGSIEAAVEDALASVDRISAVPLSLDEKHGLLRSAFIPWLATIDPDTQAPRRRVARKSEIPAAALPLIDCFVEQRLLATDAVDASVSPGVPETTVEPAHEALLRQWRLLQGWLDEERSSLITLEGIKRAANDWTDKVPDQSAADDAPWLTHRGVRLLDAERMLLRQDFARVAGDIAIRYVARCRDFENTVNAAETARIEKEKQQLQRNRKLQRRGNVFLAAAFLVLILGAWGLRVETKGQNQRASWSLAALARNAYADGYSDRAARYALAGMVGRDAWPVDFDDTLAEDALSVERQATGALGVLRGHKGQVRTAVFSRDGSKILTASYDGTANLWDVATGAVLRTFSYPTKGKVESATFSPDEKRVVTASFDGYARIWDVDSGDELGPPLEHNDGNGNLGQVWSAVFSPDGKLLATAAGDGSVRLWDAGSYHQLPFAARRESVEVRHVAFSNDGSKLLTAAQDGSVRLLDVKTGQPDPAFVLPDSSRNGEATAVFSPGDRYVAVAYSNGCVLLWNASTGTAEYLRLKSPEADDGKAMRVHSDFIYSVAFDQQGERLVTASADHTAKVWDTKTGRLLRTLQQDKSVRDAVFSPDGEEIATASDDGSARVWSANTGQELFRYLGHEGRLWSVAFAGDGSRFVTASYDGTARIWDANIGRAGCTSSDGGQAASAGIQSGKDEVKQQPCVVILSGHATTVRSVAFSPDGKFVATGSFKNSDVDNFARIWDAGSGKLLAEIPVYDRVQAVSFSHDGRYLATGSVERFLAQVWDWRKCDSSGSVDCHVTDFLHRGIVMEVAFSPGDDQLLTASRDHLVRIWNLADNKTPVQIYLHPSGVATAAFSPDGSRVLSGSYEDAAIWDPHTGNQICPLPGHQGAVRDAEFSRDGRFAVTASEDSSVRIWDATGTLHCDLLHKIELPGDSIWSAAFSRDGGQLVLASDTLKAARIFDIASGREIAVLRGHSGAVYQAVYSPDGERIATASDDHTARIWRVPHGEILKGENLVDDFCKRRLKLGLSSFTERELIGAPVLDQSLDRDPCHPASFWQRLIASFR